MKTLLATIEHSGTRFVLGAFELVGRCASLECENRSPEVNFLFAHLLDEQMPLIREAVQRMHIVTTYRDVDSIRASWIRRGKPLSRLDEQLRNYTELLTFKPTVISLGEGSKRFPPYKMGGD